MGTHPIFESDFDCLTDMIKFTDLAARHGVELYFECALTPPPSSYVDQYMGDLNQLLEQLIKLVQLTPRQFWSTVIFNKKCQHCVSITLQNLPRQAEYSRLIPQYKTPMKKLAKVIKSVLMRIITRREIQDKTTPMSNLDFLLDLNTYADYCAVFGGDNDSERVVYSFVTWKEDLLLGQLGHFGQMLTQGIDECLAAAATYAADFSAFTVEQISGTYMLLGDMLHTTLALIKSDTRIRAAMATRDLFQRIVAAFSQIKQSEVELVSEFLIHEAITGPFVLSKILTIRIGQAIIDSRFAKVRAKKATAQLAQELKAFLELAKPSPDFIEHMNENENSDLAALARLVSTAYPSVISSKERDAFIASCTVHHEVAAAKGENQPTATAVQLVKDMFPDLGTGFVEELIGFYRGKTEEIINALLEDNLHPQVAGLSRTLRSKTEIEKDSKKKTIIPGLYHKNAKVKPEDEMGNRKDQIYVNAVAKQYKYVVEEVTVAPKKVEIIEDEESGVKYRAGDGDYDDEYDDTYDDVQKGDDFDPYAFSQARTREKITRERTVGSTLADNPNLPVQENDDDADDTTTTESADSRPQSRNYDSRRKGKVSAPRAAYGQRADYGGQQPQRERAKLDENASKLAKRRKDANKATRANHNRKAMSDKKHSQGMF